MEVSKTVRRNGKIELLRFVFAICVLCYHVVPDAWGHRLQLASGFYLFSKGKLGVEFFFLLSGFFLAKTVDRQFETSGDASTNLGESTFAYMQRRIAAVLPFHIAFCLAALAIRIIAAGIASVPKQLLYSIPSFLLLNSTGLMRTIKPLIAPEWYLSSLFLCMLILYPLTRKYHKTLPYTVYPVVGVLCIGYLIISFRYLPGNITESNGFILACNIRAFGELCLGITCYTISKRIINTNDISRFTKYLLGAIELLCYLTVLLLMCTKQKNIEQIVLILLFIGLTLSMSELGAGNASPLFQNKLMLFLGKASLPIYLCQDVVRSIVRSLPFALTPVQHFLVAALGAVLLGMASVLVLESIQRSQRAARMG